ncbi:hypothetical protein [Microvirga flavescens]|uniref:hypothetical protein n=1 Tax=Microvirga flavescens TaxID=2249811 RepID=UPI00130025CE|nr:hypothetical protein [Microvirga flavescens]
MAKAKTKKAPSKAKKADKATTGKGLKASKLPKPLRNFAPVKDLLKSDLGREILADALIAAAAAAAAALTHASRTKKAGKKGAKKGAKAGGKAAKTASGAVASVVADAARHLLPTALMGENEEGAEAPARRAQGTSSPQYAHLASNHSKRKTSKKTSLHGTSGPGIGIP